MHGNGCGVDPLCDLVAHGTFVTGAENKHAATMLACDGNRGFRESFGQPALGGTKRRAGTDADYWKLHAEAFQPSEALQGRAMRSFQADIVHLGQLRNHTSPAKQFEIVEALV